MARQRGVQLNVVLEADSLALQLGIASQGGAYAQMWMLQQQEEGGDEADDVSADVEGRSVQTGGVA